LLIVLRVVLSMRFQKLPVLVPQVNRTFLQIVQARIQ
jgi:hypothetical protein